ncbi:MAG: hypothetical protein KKA79_01105 [Nanoarchaeota archaeon]|nr:hypothetical protein [Nanoarchaeota archaeon]
MRKIISILLVLAILALSGCGGGMTGGAVVCNQPYILVGQDCCLDENDNSICDKDEIEKITAEEVEPPKQEVVEEQIVEEVVEEEIVEEEPEERLGEYIVKKGDTIYFEGREIKINNIGFFQTVLVVDMEIEGTAVEIYDTKSPYITHGMEIQTLLYEQLKGQVILKIENFELGPNEYLFDTRTKLEISGVHLALVDIVDDGAVIFDINTGSEILKKNIDVGESFYLDGLELTNLKSFTRGVKIGRKAIIKIIS